MASPPRILLVTGADPAAADRLASLAPAERLVRTPDLPHALDLLAREPFDAVLTDPTTLTAVAGPIARVERQKLEALHQAGRELSGLAPEQLADMSAEERKELLKLNLRRSIHDLLHYDVIEIRRLDRLTGKLEPLLAEGMTPDAARRELRASETGNGVTGLVAATGRSYLCPDTALDPHYIEGAAGARSSLTVPLEVQDQVIGTLNVESPRPNAFTPEDLQFTELFSREIAQALHTLELLSAEKLCSTTQSVEAINREIALPVDEVLAAATSLLARHRDPADDEPLRRIITSARSIKQAVLKMGEGLTSAAPEGGPPSRLKGMRVLVVDGDERTRKLAHGILDRFGCVVETARTGHEALDLASLHPYDAILTDIRLPDLSGFEAYRRLREARPGARMALMTGFGYDAQHAIINARREGLQFVIFKPFRPDQLLEALLSPDKPTTVPEPESQPEVIQAS
jgi:CheY-like chemotaxis protein